MPFDQFTIEQLAGDLLPEHTLDNVVASGFNRCNITTNEGGVIPEEYLVLYTRDRTETVGRVWMGLTANCAVCHDHKFDPLSQREFYSLAAFFNNSTQGAMDGNIRDTPPIITVPRSEDRPRWEALSRSLAEVRRDLQTRRQVTQKDFESWLARAAQNEVAARIPSQGLHFHAPLSEGNGNTIGFVRSGQAETAVVKGKVSWDAGHVAARAFQSQPGSTLEVPSAGDFEKNQPSKPQWADAPTRADDAGTPMNRYVILDDPAFPVEVGGVIQSVIPGRITAAASTSS